VVDNYFNKNRDTLPQLRLLTRRARFPWPTLSETRW
jgi:hypothetical protein